MKIYHIKRTNPWGYDNYSDAVVVASSAQKARLVHPYVSEYQGHVWSKKWNGKHWVDTKDGVIIDDEYPSDYVWTEPNNIKATLIGHTYRPTLKEGDVICASFHAG